MLTLPGLLIVIGMPVTRCAPKTSHARLSGPKNMMLKFSPLVAGFVLAVASALAAPSRPNVLILLADDLGYADVGFNGAKDIRTPNLDRFAEDGVRLDRFYACPVCSPTRAGLLTGRWPIRYGLMKAVIPPWSEYGLPESERTLPELLAGAGYERRGMVGKWHLGHYRRAMLPPQRGFTDYYGHYNGAIDYFTHLREGELDWHRQNEPAREPGYSTDLLADAAVKFIQDSPESRPWFLYAAFNAPHEPLEAKPEDLEKYAGLKGDRKTYAAMVDSLDQAIGRVLAAVAARSDADNTLVLFMSDNGGMRKFADNSPWRGGKFDVYEGGIRVCAAIRWPAAGWKGGGVCDQKLGYIDVAPTVLTAAGAAMPEGGNAFDGIDMTPVISGARPAPERAWFSYFAQGGRPPGAAVSLNDWKLVHIGGEVLTADGAENVALYDLGTDPAERADVSGAHPDIVKRLGAELAAFARLGHEGVSEYGKGRKGFKAPKDWIISK